MLIEGPIQHIIDLETMILSAISGATTGEVNLEVIAENAKKIVDAAQDIPVLYFGARHFDWKLDEVISSICKEAGMVGASTPNGARVFNDTPKGTMPHALVLAVGSTSMAAKLYHEHLSIDIPRVVLVDTFGKEVTDAIDAAKLLKQEGARPKVRVDTNGAVFMQYSLYLDESIIKPFRKELMNHSSKYLKYLNGRGVTISGVLNLRLQLDNAGLDDVGIIVSSGFNYEKTEAFAIANSLFEKMYGKPLIDGIGTGSVYPPAIYATADIVSIYDPDREVWLPRSKAGRFYRPNKKLRRVQVVCY